MNFKHLSVNCAMALLSQFLLLLLLAVGASRGQCPTPEDILPCNCTNRKDYPWRDYNIKVFCWKVDDVEDVRRALQSVKGIQKVVVEFKGSRLGSVPSDLFKGLHVTELTFDHCVLKKIGDERKSALEGLENIIKKLTVRYSFSEVNELRFLNVSRLRALEYLDMEGNSMKELGNEWFAEGPANLKELSIKQNKLTSLGDRVFAHLTNLEQLQMLSNQIETLKRSMFPFPAVHLYTFSFSDNKISSLPGDFFSNMPAIKWVYLASNSIQRIPEATWAPVWSGLRSLWLDDNPLECDSHIEWTFQQKPPIWLEAKCATPEERKGVELKRIIEENQTRNNMRLLSTIVSL